MQGWIRSPARREAERSARPLAIETAVPILVAVGAAALFCSLSPGADDLRRDDGSRRRRCSISIVPVFRSCARFGVIVQLMAALLAGIGATRLVTRGTRTAQSCRRGRCHSRDRGLHGVAAGALARRAADRRAPMGDAADRRIARPRLRAADRGVLVDRLAHGRPHRAGRRRR